MASPFITAFSFRVDEYVGRRQIIGFALAATKEHIPQQLAKIHNADCDTWNIAEFHLKLKELVQNYGSIGWFGYYSSVLANSGGQNDGTPMKLNLELKLECQFSFEEETLQRFLRDGRLDDDPPVLPYTLSNPRWIDGKEDWGFEQATVKATPSGGEILVDSDRPRRVQMIFLDDPLYLDGEFSSIDP